MNLREAKQILIDNGYIIEGTRTDLESAKLSTIALTLYEKFIEMMPDNFYMINAYDKLTNGVKLEFDLSKDLLYKEDYDNMKDCDMIDHIIECPYKAIINYKNQKMNDILDKL